jgi:hypothetical protein
LYYFHKKLEIKKNPKKTFSVGFFRWVFLGGFFIANPVSQGQCCGPDPDPTFHFDAVAGPNIQIKSQNL